MKLRKMLLVAGVVAVGLAVIFNFGYITQLVHLASHVRWYVLVLVVAVQAFSYYSNAKYYQEVLAVFGYRLRLRRLFETALAINFVNQAFPSGGVSGTSFLTQELSPDVPAGKGTLVQVVRYAFTYLSFLAVLVLGFLLLFLGNEVSRVTVRLILLLILGIIIVSAVVLLLINERSKIESAAAGVVRFVNGVLRLVSRRKKRAISPQQLQRFLDEFYHGYEVLKDDRSQWLRPLLYTLTGNLAEVATVYVVFLAFGAVINPGVVIAAYTLANILSLVSVVSSGLGLYEATMTAAFVALGVPFALSLSAVVVYRAFNLIFFLPIGFYFYRQSVSRPQLEVTHES